MPKMKEFRVRFEKATYVCRSATMYVSDSHGDYDHPILSLVFCDVESPDCQRDVSIRFQRNAMRAGADGATFGQMDSRRPWSTCYAASVELQRAGEFEVRDAPFELSSDDRFRVNVARLLARTVGEYNLHHVHEDEAERLAGAVDRLGRWVEFKYQGGSRDGWVSRHELDVRSELFANNRARDEARRAAEKAA
jgi:hypothetical protein